MFDTSKRDDPLAAISWAERVLNRAEELGAHPQIGHRPRELPDGQYLELTIDRYRLLYRVRAELDVIRILTIFRGDRQLRVDELDDLPD